MMSQPSMAPRKPRHATLRNSPDGHVGANGRQPVLLGQVLEVLPRGGPRQVSDKQLVSRSRRIASAFSRSTTSTPWSTTRTTSTTRRSPGTRAVIVTHGHQTTVPFKIIELRNGLLGFLDRGVANDPVATRTSIMTSGNVSERDFACWSVSWEGEGRNAGGIEDRKHESATDRPRTP